MTAFETAYQQLNKAQRQAVDTIEGPVMVVAGPGTGKTQLLSMRVGQILRQTDATAANILCLTFTESAANAMRERLLRLIGSEAHHVAIHTFHSFGTEIINHYPEYFYQGADFRPADQLSSFEILEAIFKGLPHDNPLASTNRGQFVALKDTQMALSQLKKSGLTPDELLQLLEHNRKFIAFAEPILQKAFQVPRFTKKQLPACHQALAELKQFTAAPIPVAWQIALHELCITQFTEAVEQATAAQSTQPLTTWRNHWLERDAEHSYIFKDRMREPKMKALADVYIKYLLAMQEKQLFDFEDMILRSVHALETFPELRYNLQEQFQYILVDEFQDTNGAQLRLLDNLANAPANEGRPNLMVVGDDDQAIYAFQGAELSNILQFTKRYRDPAIISLTENYRSTEAVLRPARAVIVQGQERLETTLHISKLLQAHNHTTPSNTELHQFNQPAEQYLWLTKQVAATLQNGVPAKEIAILGRNHRQLTALLPYLHEAGIATQYERRNNVLESEHIKALSTLAQTIVALGDQQFDTVEALLPRLLSYEFWRIAPATILQLSLQAYKERRFWLELMLESSGTLQAIAEFLVVQSQLAHHESLETILDRLIGSEEQQVSNDTYSELAELTEAPIETFSPGLRDYYFSKTILQKQPAIYLRRLSNLVALRQALREYHPDRPKLLRDFVEFITLHQKAELPIIDSAEQAELPNAIHVMTAHKAKGLEFDHVFIINGQESVWGATARSKTSSVRFPNNLPIAPESHTEDDCLRLFYVAMTRARRHLAITYPIQDEAGKEQFAAAFLQLSLPEPIVHAPDSEPTLIATALEPRWNDRYLLTGSSDQKALLQPQLDTYLLSSTHLNNFIDVANGGPQAFLLQNILRFPQAMSREALFGSIIHRVLQRAHTHLSSSGERRPLEDVMHDFELQLQQAHVSEADFSYLFEKGSSVLQGFLAQRYQSFTPAQRAEFSFRYQGVVVSGARLTGALDVLEIDQTTKTIVVTDYKTGKPAHRWYGGSDYEKCKLHKYRQQLMMYKLLVENSRDFAGYTVPEGRLTFVEPDATGAIADLTMTFDAEELARFRQLLGVVWEHIQLLDLPDTSGYKANYQGILAFEEDLLSGAI